MIKRKYHKIPHDFYVKYCQLNNYKISGLFVKFINKIEDVTAQTLEGVSDDMGLEQRNALIEENIEALVNAAELGEFEEFEIKPFYEGNQFYAFYTISYPDVRLVGAPPSSIGKFGADTDNWVWPRHTGDFSIFRIYRARIV